MNDRCDAWHDGHEVRLAFERYVVRGDGCWGWSGSKHTAGYGRFSAKGRIFYAHRVAYELFVGAIPSGLHVDHLCRNPECSNPDHLEAVTQAENNRRSEEARGVKRYATHCIHGHEYTPDNTRVKANGTRDCRACNIARCAARRAAA